MKILIFAFVYSLVFAFAANAQTQATPKSEERPEVVKAVAPERYPPAALAVRAVGNVYVSVNIDENGDVTTAHLISGHPLLRDASVKAAKLWKFLPLKEKARKGFAQLTFYYKSEVKEDEAGIYFEAPYRVSILAPLPKPSH